MSEREVVSDASPLIALDRIGRLDLLRELFGTVTVPPAVAAEVFADREPPAWVTVASKPETLGVGSSVWAQVRLRAMCGPATVEFRSLGDSLTTAQPGILIRRSAAGAFQATVRSPAGARHTSPGRSAAEPWVASSKSNEP